MDTGCDDFRVTFTPLDDDTFTVAAVAADGATADAVFRLPLSDDDMRRAVLAEARSRHQFATRDVAAVYDVAVPAQDPARLGAQLAAALLSGDVGECYDRARATARGNGRGLRLSLSLAGAPSLLSVPWEFLFRRPTFLASQRDTPLVRVLDTGATTPPPTITDKVHILGVVSSPSDLGRLDVAAERRRVEQAVAAVVATGRVDLDWLEPATPRRLREMLRDGSYHVVHYVGHSDFIDAKDDVGEGEGVLFLEDDNGGAVQVDSTVLANLLSDQRRLRLVVLNSCEGARTTLTDPYAGVATTLIQLGVPAVVAMQFEISDPAAILFAEELYTNLLGREESIDASVAEARKAIYVEMNQIEWATPVLFVREPEVELFRFEVDAPPLDPLPPPIPPEPDEPDEPDRPRRFRRVLAVIGALVALAVLAGAAVTLWPEGEEEPDEPSPRGRTDVQAVEVLRPNGDRHLLLVDPQDNTTGTATDNPDALDTEPSWAFSANWLAFRREDSSPGGCIGLCYVVPGIGDGDPGKQVAQLVPGESGTLHHAPAWVGDSSLYYAATRGGCTSPGTDCPGEVRRATFQQSDDGSGFRDALEVDLDRPVVTGLTGIRDLAGDPWDENRVLVLADGGSVVYLDGEREATLPEGGSVEMVAFAADGHMFVGVDGQAPNQSLLVWDREATLLSDTPIADIAASFVASGGDLGGLDPARIELRSLSTGLTDSQVVVLFADPSGSTVRVVAIHVSESAPIIVTADALPLDITDKGEILGIAQ